MAGNNIASKARSSAGFTLLELMIATALGLFLAAGVTTMVVAMSRDHREIQQQSEVFDNGRYGSAQLADEIRHAGFYGQFAETDDPSSLLDPCVTDASKIKSNNHLGLAVQGYNAPTGNPTPSCLGDANHEDGTDILVVRRAAREATDVTDLTAGRIYIQGRPDDYVLAEADGSDTSDASTFDLEDRDGDRTDIRAFRVNIFFISPCLDAGGGDCTDTADDGDPIPTLKRLELTAAGGSPLFESEPVASGIQQLQLEYGIDDPPLDGQPDCQDDSTSPCSVYVTDPGTVANWLNVVTVQSHALGRTLETVSGHTDERSYSLGDHGAVGPFNDAYQRHLFTRTARVTNRSGRREGE